jgi:hypothetical protein
MKEDRLAAAAVLGALLAIGMAVGGGQVARALYRVKAAERYVTVRGLSEREVAANLAMWPMSFGVAGDDLGQVQAALEAATSRIAAFLTSKGFSAKEFSVSSPRVNDFEAQGVRGTDRPLHRYAAEATVTLRSEKVDLVRTTMAAAGELVRAGVALRNDYGASPRFLYTALESIKPPMIVEATKDARRAAEQFASDSGSRVGAIRHAQQGYFAIEDRDDFSPEFKKVRVVTTVEYFLED